MDPTPYSLLAAGIAFLIVLVELITSEYRHTFVWTLRCWQLWLYAAVYAVIAYSLYSLLDDLQSEKLVELSGSFIDLPWVQAVGIGVSTKALMQVTLFNVQTSGVSTMPIGISTITQLFEPWFLERLKLKVWNKVREFIEPHAQKYNNPDTVLETIKDNFPPNWKREKKAAVLAELEQYNSPQTLMYFFVETAGKDTLVRAFPLDS